MMYQITGDNLLQYLSEGENENLEFKVKVPSSAVLERLIAAFANTSGGCIIFGCDEQRNEIVGVSSDQIDKLRRMLVESGLQNSCDMQTKQVEDKIVVVLSVPKSPKDVYIKGIAYHRIQDQIYSRIGNVRSKYLNEFIDEIKYRNRNPRDTKALGLMEDVSTNPERILPIGTVLYRCRIINDMSQTGKETNYWGYGKDDSFVPPWRVTRDMRANYRYIPYLYCATHQYTALVEVRPRLGANVSIATIRVDKSIRLLDFTLKTIPKKMSTPKQNLFSDLSMLFSKPVTTEDDILDYIPTQYIAEYAKHLGYDGIAFRSSLTPELDDSDENDAHETDRYNVVIFNYDKCSPCRSNIVNITRNYIKYEQRDNDEERIDIPSAMLDSY